VQTKQWQALCDSKPFVETKTEKKAYLRTFRRVLGTDGRVNSATWDESDSEAAAEAEAGSSWKASLLLFCMSDGHIRLLIGSHVIRWRSLGTFRSLSPQQGASNLQISAEGVKSHLRHLNLCFSAVQKGAWASEQTAHEWKFYVAISEPSGALIDCILITVL
jgi:hypothetical protein